MVAGLDENGRVIQALLWANEGDYFSEASKRVAEAVKEAGKENAGIMVGAIIAQEIPVINVAVDLYFLYQGIKGAAGAVKGLQAAFVSAGKATNTVELQRESAKLATAIVGQGIQAILSLLAIAGTAAAIKGKITKIKTESPGISDEEALNKALQDTPKEKVSAFSEAAARTRIRQRFDPEGVLDGLMDKGVSAVDLEQALMGGTNPVQIRLITHGSSDVARMQSLIKYTAENGAPISGFLKAGAEPALVGRLMDGGYKLPDVTSGLNTYTVAGAKRFNALKLDEAVRMGRMDATALQRVNGLLSDQAFTMLAKRGESMHQQVAVATELSSSDAAMNGELVKLLERHGANAVGPADLEATLTRLNEFVLRHQGRVGGDYATRFLRSVRTKGDPVQAAAELDLAEDILAGKTPLGQAQKVEGLPETGVQGQKLPEYRVTPGGGGPSRLAETKVLGEGDLKVEAIKRNLRKAISQIADESARTGEQGAFVRLNASQARPSSLAEGEMEGAINGQMTTDRGGGKIGCDYIEWVELLYKDANGTSQRILMRTVGRRMARQ
jgi:hypothetical protein